MFGFQRPVPRCRSLISCFNISQVWLDRDLAMALALCFWLFVLTGSTQAVPTLAQAVVAEPESANSIVSATCQLIIRGKNLAGPITSANETDAKTTDQGVQKISLACSTVPAGQQVPIAVNRTWITPAHSSGFQVGGVCDCRQGFRVVSCSWLVSGRRRRVMQTPGGTESTPCTPFSCFSCSAQQCRQQLQLQMLSHWSTVHVTVHHLAGLRCGLLT